MKEKVLPMIDIQNDFIEDTEPLVQKIMKRKAVIVVDAQIDFIWGVLGTKEAQAALLIIKKIIDDGNYVKLFFTRDTHDENYLNTLEGKMLPIPHCKNKTQGWQIDSSLDTTKATMIIDKPSFGWIGWKGLLDDVDEIILVGFCTNVCVISNALIIKALYPEIKVSIIANATAGTTPEGKAVALETARSCQINII